MAGSISLEAIGSPSVNCPYQGDDTMGIGQIVRSITISEKLSVVTGMIWRDEFTLATGGAAESMDTDALLGSWCGSSISINFATIYAVAIQVDPGSATVDNTVVLSTTGGAGGTFPLVGQTVNLMGDGLFTMGSVGGWTCGTTLVIKVTNNGDATRTFRVAIAGDE